MSWRRKRIVPRRNRRTAEGNLRVAKPEALLCRYVRGRDALQLQTEQHAESETRRRSALGLGCVKTRPSRATV
jgi:hypothetical protein